MSKEMRTKMMRMMVDKCGKREGASQEDIDLMIAKKPPITFKGKCIGACLAETAGIVNINTFQSSHYNKLNRIRIIGFYFHLI